jgi:Na+/proline symporter
MPLPDNHALQDPQTGNLAVTWAIIIFGCIVVLYTMAGGLWAVLMTDVIQFLILTLSVIFVVPLMLIEVGGFQSFVSRAPDKFFDLVAGDYTWTFLTGWCMVNFFMIGGDWAFAQRFISVRSQSEAKKSAYFFGILYLVSPFLWLSPPLLYRVIEPSANPEQAYILASQLVLPAGMLGMMVAAMFSATASMVSSQINVFAGGLTNSVYQGEFRSEASEKELLWAGRLFSMILGASLITIAIFIPVIGGAAKIVISKSTLIMGPMLAPAIWGLFSRSLSVAALWAVAGVSAFSTFMLRFAVQENGFLSDVSFLSGISSWAQEGEKSVDLTIGIVMPILVLAIFQIFSRGENSRWNRLQALSAERAAEAKEGGDQPFDPTPGWVVVIALGIISLMMFIVAVVSDEFARSLLIFASATLGLALAAGAMILRTARR